MRISLSTAAIALLLTACGQPSSTTTTTTAGNTTSTTPATTTDRTGLPTAGSLGLQPGKWETKIAITGLEMNGVSRPVPPGGQSVLTCVTPEMASKGPGEFLKKAGIDCTTANTSYADGKISAQMTCKMPMGTMTSTTTGSYSPTAMTSDAEAIITGRMAIKEKIHTEAHRVGECG